MTSPAALSPHFRAILQAQPTRTMECIAIGQLRYFKSLKLPAIYLCQKGCSPSVYNYVAGRGNSAYANREIAWEEIRELAKVMAGSETRVK